MLALTALNVRAEQTQIPALKDVFAGDFRVGVALSRSQIEGRDGQALDFVRRHFNSLTAENVMKWERIEPEEGRFDWAPADALVNFAEENGMHLAGHVLIWHQQTPDWVFEDAEGQPASRELLLQRMQHHIESVVGRYRGRVDSWEVVNEVFNEDGSFRESPWFTLIGEDFIEQAFAFAHAADPDAQLYFNDYNLYKPAKRDGAIRLGRKLLDQGVRLDAIGLQAHYGLDNPGDLQQVSDTIEAIGKLGLKARVTEMDLAVLPFPASEEWGADISVSAELQARHNPYADGLPDSVAAEQAARYAGLFAIFLEHRQYVDRVTFWGLTDGHSWKNNWPIRGRTDYPLLFDRAYRPKAAYREVIALKQ